ncbi:ribonucleoside-diphosphate reductase, adenosylcobalamin-dependent [Marinitoga piezophila KA3]|uniref:Vitamin B12-dependent ribonucleotide reductase n=1 Tax=Marinitoga piezophila (strain DSM 14283 / JCM 11233 / KA3) TaxID=443254 RepID=H2J4A3_MARPK|nr:MULTISPECIES: adenosylcobalamin-dependent ribonucleoside-diphosphate reductase [Marinitoga]AEX85918.1 ribonucleoside-diphosphate reductase, adenosylcobalamin-dependent [Marinitoga piezophila KA3]
MTEIFNLDDFLDHFINISPSENAERILRDRYFLKDGEGNYLEHSWEDITRRVSRYIASAEILYTEDIEEIRNVEKKFYKLLKSRVFLPNSPTLFNSGKTLPLEIFKKPLEEMTIEDYKRIYNSRNRHNMLSACFVVPLEDSMEGIFEAVKDAALIQKYGGGVGYDFSVLRPKDSSIAGTGGKSSGPISFMNVFNTTASTIEQGGARRGAQMAVMRYDHPDVIDFINSKKNNDGKSVLNYFNISVNFDNPEEFLKKLENDEEIELSHPNSNIKKTIKARELFDLIANNAWKSGDPGMLFLGRHNKYYALSDVTPVSATNPCGEEPLPPYGSCNLGSIDLAKVVDFVNLGNPDHENNELFKDLIYWCSRFLDDVIDINVYPLEEIDKVSKEQRFIGLGIMGLADALFKKELAYNSEEGRRFMAESTAQFAYYSHLASTELAKERGSFPLFDRSKYKKGFIPFAMLKDDFSENIRKWNELIRKHFFNEAKEFKRNVQVNTVAPTGSISNIADTSSGIEPNFMLAYIRYMTDKEGNRVPLPYMNRILKEKLDGELTSELEAEIIEKGSVQNIEGISEEIKRVFVTAMDISGEDHLMAQHMIQSYLDASCSKTINLPKEATVDDIKNIYKMAMELSLKGITIYRDGSLETQVLTKAKKKDDKKVTFFVLDEKHKLRARPRKDTLKSVTRKYKTGSGTVYITVSFDDNGEAIEIFLSDGTETAEIIGRLSSIALRSGVSADEILEQLSKVKGTYCKGISGEIKKALEDFEDLWKDNEGDIEVFHVGKPLSREEVEKFVHANKLEYTKGYYIDNEGNTYCPTCLSKNSLLMTEGCISCKTCGWSKCS